MDQTEQPSQGDWQQTAKSAGNAKPKKERPPKPTFELFLEQWRASLAVGKGGLGQIRSMLKKGFAGEAKHEYLLQLCDALTQNSAAAERIAVVLATQTRLGKLNSLSRSLLEQIRMRFCAGIEYHSDEFGGANGAQAVERFVESNAPRRRGNNRRDQPATGEQGRSTTEQSELTADSWLRQFFVCLCAEAEPKVFFNGTIAAGKWWLALNSRALAQGRDDVNLARAVSNCLSTGTVSKQKLELIFTGINPLQHQFATLLNRELELSRRVQNRDAEIERLERGKADLEYGLAAAQAEATAARNTAAQTQQSLNEAQEKYQLLDQHWRAVSDQNLKKQSGSFRERVGLELQEALLSLERQTPNISMALRRLKRIDEILKGSGAREE